MQRIAGGLVVTCILVPPLASAGCGGQAFGTAASSTDAGDDHAATATTNGDSAADAAPGTDESNPASPPDATVDGAAESNAPANGCPQGRGPVMVRMGTFCIDSTEVTSGQYNEFLLTGPTLTGQPAQCAFNTTYLPGGGWTFTPSQASLPIVQVDWCDAYAFCQWAGKRLCGKLGGGNADFTKFASNDNEHYVACSINASRIYPYGNTFDPTACNGIEHDAGHALPVGSLPGCQGGVPGLFDMSGNVEEWQDSCGSDAGLSDLCLNGNGSFMHGTPPTGTRCDFGDSAARNSLLPDVGIRCCAAAR
jgi:formylglycine-generating enzyme required for sulfatase activity